jgi:hypothetical protein
MDDFNQLGTIRGGLRIIIVCCGPQMIVEQVEASLRECVFFHCANLFRCAQGAANLSRMVLRVHMDDYDQC